MMHVGDIMSTSRDVQYIGVLIEIERLLSPCSLTCPPQCTEHPSLYSIYPPMYSRYLPDVLNIPRCTHDIPRCTHGIPLMY